MLYTGCGYLKSGSTHKTAQDVIVTITTKTSTSDVIDVETLVASKSTEREHIQEENCLLKEGELNTAQLFKQRDGRRSTSSCFLFLSSESPER